LRAVEMTASELVKGKHLVPVSLLPVYDRLPSEMVRIVIRVFVIALFATAALIAVGTVTVRSLQPYSVTYTVDRLPSKEDLERRKLAEDISKQHADNTLGRQLVSVLTPLLTVLVAAVGVFLTGQAALADRRVAAVDSRRKRFDDRFAELVTWLGSSNAQQHRGAVVLITAMVRDRSDELSEQAINMLVATLQSTWDDPVTSDQLVSALAQALRNQPELLLAPKEGGLPPILLSRVVAPGIDLTSLDATGQDLSYAQLPGAILQRMILLNSTSRDLVIKKARLHRATLRRARWRGVKGQGASFHYADLRGASLDYGDLRDAQFRKARLQRANFTGSDLRRARFAHAQVAGADFRGCRFTDGTLRTFLTASRWEDAMFDTDTLQRLRELAAVPSP
jgi:uncharacterized protein YjbI with pentapeptide repeats